MAAPRIQVVRDDDAPRERYQDGWRTGKPVEDPDKLKRWGFVGAKPSEYLVCTRGGHIVRGRSGQGMRIFKWPWDSVAIVPTTLQRIEFVADQITRERVGVEVSGVAVYRIAQQQQATELELQRARQAVTLELRLRDAEATDRESQLEAESQRRAAELEQLLAETRNTRALVLALPQIAAALVSKVDTMHYTQLGTGGTSPLDAVPNALAQVLALAKSFGVTIRE